MESSKQLLLRKTNLVCHRAPQRSRRKEEKTSKTPRNKNRKISQLALSRKESQRPTNEGERAQERVRKSPHQTDISSNAEMQTKPSSAERKRKPKDSVFVHVDNSNSVLLCNYVIVLLNRRNSLLRQLLKYVINMFMCRLRCWSSGPLLFGRLIACHLRRIDGW